METYRTIRNDLKHLKPPEVPSISGIVLSKLIQKREKKKKKTFPFLIIIGASILITILLWRKK